MLYIKEITNNLISNLFMLGALKATPSGVQWLFLILLIND